MEFDSEIEDEEYGLYEAKCHGCDIIAKVNDLGLCSWCAAKLERDMLRQRDWDYSASVFGVPKDKREKLRSMVIKEYGERLELIADKQPKRKAKCKRNNGR